MKINIYSFIHTWISGECVRVAIRLKRYTIISIHFKSINQSKSHILSAVYLISAIDKSWCINEINRRVWGKLSAKKKIQHHHKQLIHQFESTRICVNDSPLFKQRESVREKRSDIGKIYNAGKWLPNVNILAIFFIFVFNTVFISLYSLCIVLFCAVLCCGSIAWYRYNFDVNQTKTKLEMMIDGYQFEWTHSTYLYI